MAGVSKAVSDAVYEKASHMLKESSRGGDISRKLQAIKSAKEYGIQKVAQVFGISRVALMSWIKAFESNGVEGFKLQSGQGRKALIRKTEKAVIQEWILDDCNLTIKAVKLKIETELKKSLSMAATHRLMKSLNFSYIKPCAKHYKQDSSLHDDLKKLKLLCSNEPDRLVFFFDEARFGTHSKLGHGWFIRGSKTAMSVKLGFKNFYLYSAVSPINGEDFTV